jgi:hypothetical protein
MELNIKISGYKQGDLEFALEEVVKKVKVGSIGFRDENDTGSYHFWIDGEEVEEWVISPMELNVDQSIESIEHYLIEDRYYNLDEAQEMLKDEALLGKKIYGISDDGIVLVEVV